MTVSLADIDRWRPGDVREVFNACKDWAQADTEAADGIATLPGFADWGGDAADAAKGAQESLRRDLDAHGQQALAVANAAEDAADAMDGVIGNLENLENQARGAGLVVDRVTNQVQFGPELDTADEQAKAEATRQKLQAELAALLARAATVDDDLAAAIQMATGAAPMLDSPYSDDPDVQRALSGELPENPRQFNETWGKLNTAEKDAIYRQNPNIGNRDGMPVIDRDHYNQRNLTERLIPTAESNIARLEQQWAAEQQQHRPSGRAGAAAVDYATKNRLDAERVKLAGYREAQQVLDRTEGPDRYLLSVGDQGRLVTSVGNPDTASRNAIFVPGTGQDMARLGYSDDKSLAMFNAALAANAGLGPGDVAVTTFMGYDRPMSVPEAAFPGRAEDGGVELSAFLDGLHASHTGQGDHLRQPAIDTVIGHSYGSTVVGGAATDGNHLAAENVIAVGSPGMLADHASELQLDSGGKVYAMTAENDVISIAAWAATPFLEGDPIDDSFGAVRLEADPGTAGGPLAWLPLLGPQGALLSILGADGTVDAHGEYWNNPTNKALQNMGAVIAGVTPPHIAGR